MALPSGLRPLGSLPAGLRSLGEQARDTVDVGGATYSGQPEAVRAFKDELQMAPEQASKPGRAEKYGLSLEKRAKGLGEQVAEGVVRGGGQVGGLIAGGIPGAMVGGAGAEAALRAIDERTGGAPQESLGRALGRGAIEGATTGLLGPVGKVGAAVGGKVLGTAGRVAGSSLAQGGLLGASEGRLPNQSDLVSGALMGAGGEAIGRFMPKGLVSDLVNPPPTVVRGAGGAFRSARTPPGQLTGLSRTAYRIGGALQAAEKRNVLREAVTTAEQGEAAAGVAKTNAETALRPLADATELEKKALADAAKTTELTAKYRSAKYLGTPFQKTAGIQARQLIAKTKKNVFGDIAAKESALYGSPEAGAARQATSDYMAAQRATEAARAEAPPVPGLGTQMAGHLTRAAIGGAIGTAISPGIGSALGAAFAPVLASSASRALAKGSATVGKWLQRAATAPAPIQSILRGVAQAGQDRGQHAATAALFVLARSRPELRAWMQEADNEGSSVH